MNTESIKRGRTLPDRLEFEYDPLSQDALKYEDRHLVIGNFITDLNERGYVVYLVPNNDHVEKYIAIKKKSKDV